MNRIHKSYFVNNILLTFLQIKKTTFISIFWWMQLPWFECAPQSSYVGNSVSKFLCWWIWKQGLWEVIRVGQVHEDEFPWGQLHKKRRGTCAGALAQSHLRCFPLCQDIPKCPRQMPKERCWYHAVGLPGHQKWQPNQLLFFII